MNLRGNFGSATLRINEVKTKSPIFYRISKDGIPERWRLEKSCKRNWPEK